MFFLDQPLGHVGPMAGQATWAFVTCQEDWQSRRSGFNRSDLLKEQAVLPRVQKLYNLVCQEQPALASLFKEADPSDSNGSALFIHGIVSVVPGLPFQHLLSPGWSDDALKIHAKVFEGALDAYLLHVRAAFCIPTWEERPQILVTSVPQKQGPRNACRNLLAPVGARDRAHKKAGVFQISSWKVSDKIDVEGLVDKINVFQPSSTDSSFKTLRTLIPADVVNLKELPVLHIPRVLALLILCGKWTELPTLSRWTHPFFPALCAGLEASWLRDVKTATTNSNTGGGADAVMTLEEASEVASLLRRVGLKALETILDEDLEAGLSLDLNKCLFLLQRHMNALDPMRAAAVKKLARLRYVSETIVPQLLCSFDLRSKKMLQHHAAQFVQILPEAWRPALKSWVDSDIASGATLQRAEIVLDVAMQLLHRERMSEAGEVLKYAWGDATSKFDLELYNGRYRWLKKSMVVELARAWRFLCNNPAKANSSEALQAQRCEYSTLLFQNVHLHTLVPQRLGDKRTSLEDKVSAYIHASLLESTDLSDLDKNFQNHVSWCSDMGVEANIPNFFLKQVEDALPPWLRPARVNVVSQDDVEDGAELLIGQEEEPAKPLMQHAFQISGVCHAVHNSLGFVQTGFEGFEDFLGKLKCLYKFLGNPLRVHRFVEVVMRGSVHFERAKCLFAKKLTSIYTERWNILAICLQESFPMVQFLRLHWDVVRFADDPHKSSLEVIANPSLLDGWVPQEVTKILNDAYFLAYWQMQMKLHSVLLEFQSWAEGCSCHGPPLSATLRNRKDDADTDGNAEEEGFLGHQAALRSEITTVPGVPLKCPLMGCQAPFLASDSLTSLEALLKSCTQEFIAECTERLSNEQWTSLLDEMGHASAVVMEQLRFRLSFYSSFPWVLLAGAHPVEDVARKALKGARDMWDGLSEAVRKQQHLLVKDLFHNTGPGTLREQMDIFIDEEKHLEECGELEAWFAPFSFVQVAERLIEAAHKDVGQRPKNFTMTTLSLNLRMPELNEFLAKDPSSFATLVESFEEARDLKKIANLFPCYRNHPDFVALAQTKQLRLFERFARQAFYRDSRMQFAENLEGVKNHEKQKKTVEKANAKISSKKKAPPSETTIIANLSSDCLRERAWLEPGLVFSCGSHDLLYSPVPRNQNQF